MNELAVSCPSCGEDAIRLDAPARGHPRVSTLHRTTLRWDCGTAWARCGNCRATWKLARLLRTAQPQTAAAN